MSRLYGRTPDIYNVSKYIMENYNGKYQKDKTKISYDELEKSRDRLEIYLPESVIDYLKNTQIDVSWNLFIKDTIYSGYGEARNAIIFPTKQIKEDYKRDYVYFIGDLLRRLSLDYIPDEFDIRCQYSDVLPLLMEYLFLRDCGKENRFSDRHLQDLKLNANEYIKIYERFENNKESSNEQLFLRNSLLYLVPLSSMDATLQISDDLVNDKESLKQLIKELIENETHNREDVLNKRNINTYGFKRLRKEITNRR